MIILDTNVVSEVMNSRCNPTVRSWLDRQAQETLALTTINFSELLFGVELLPPGRQRQEYSDLLEEFVGVVLGGRVLPFDELSARAFARIMSESRSRGRAISHPHGQIAAIAKVHKFTVATRDISPFEAAGVAFINPWEM